MGFTQRDLDIVERRAAALERFVEQHKQMLAEYSWGPDLKAAAEELLNQFESALAENRTRCEIIRNGLHKRSSPE